MAGHFCKGSNSKFQHSSLFHARSVEEFKPLMFPESKQLTSLHEVGNHSDFDQSRKWFSIHYLSPDLQSEVRNSSRPNACRIRMP